MNTYLIYDSTNQAQEVQADYFDETEGTVIFFRETVTAVASFYHPVSVVLKEEETIKEAPVNRSEGKRVAVYDGDEGVNLPLFFGMAAVSPYAEWHRVIPAEGYIDLPPRFKVVPR